MYCGKFKYADTTNDNKMSIDLILSYTLEEGIGG